MAKRRIGDNLTFVTSGHSPQAWTALLRPEIFDASRQIAETLAFTSRQAAESLTPEQLRQEKRKQELRRQIADLERLQAELAELDHAS